MNETCDAGHPAEHLNLFDLLWCELLATEHGERSWPRDPVGNEGKMAAALSLSDHPAPVSDRDQVGHWVVTA